MVIATVEAPKNERINPKPGIDSATNTIKHTIPVRTRHRFMLNTENEKQKISVIFLVSITSNTAVHAVMGTKK